jgi:hypothetical protein
MKKKRDLIKTAKALSEQQDRLQKQKDSLYWRERKIVEQIALLTAKEKGIFIGSRYKVIPPPGRRAFAVVVREIGHGYSHKKFDSVSVLCFLEGKQEGIYGQRYFNTDQYEFIPLPQQEEAATNGKVTE